VKCYKKRQQSITVPDLVLPLGVENTDVIQEALKFTWPRPVLLVASRLFHHIDEMICFPLLVVALGQARLVHVAQLLLLLLLSCVEGHLLGQGVFVSDGEHFFRCPWVFYGELIDQGQVPESLFVEHNNRLIVDLRDDVSFVAKMLDELPEGLSLLLDDAG
jgi:hypothetical protein